MGTENHTLGDRTRFPGTLPPKHLPFWKVLPSDLRPCKAPVSPRFLLLRPGGLLGHKVQGGHLPSPKYRGEFLKGDAHLLSGKALDFPASVPGCRVISAPGKGNCGPVPLPGHAVIFGVPFLPPKMPQCSASSSLLPVGWVVTGHPFRWGLWG